MGLRAGWGLALFAVLAAIFGTLLFLGLSQAAAAPSGARRDATQQSAARTSASAPLSLRTVSISEVAEASAVLAAAFVLSLLEGRRFRVYGLGLRRVRDLLPGAIFGLLAIALLVGLLRALHLLVFDRQLLHGVAALRYGVAWLATFALVGIFEEFLFRGYVQFTLMRGLLGLAERVAPARTRPVAFWAAALVWSTLFSLTHLANAGEDRFGIIMVFAAGMLFSYALWRTGALWWGVGFHLTWDWGQSFLFGVPDSGGVSVGRLFQTHSTGRTLLSGGSTGPEGSVLVLPVLLLVAVVIRLHPAEPQPPVEPESFPLLGRADAAKRIP